jgi:hypothetical protein
VTAFLEHRITPDIGTISVTAEPPLSYIVPQRWSHESSGCRVARLSFRSEMDGRGCILVSNDDKIAYRGRLKRVRANRQLRLSIDALTLDNPSSSIRVRFMPSTGSTSRPRHLSPPDSSLGISVAGTNASLHPGLSGKRRRAAAVVRRRS